MDGRAAGARDVIRFPAEGFARHHAFRACRPGREHVYYLYTIRVEGRRRQATLVANDRGNEVRSDFVQQRLKEHGIASTVYYPVPLHLQPLYASLGGKPGDFRVSERAAREVLSIPLYPELTREQIERVAQEVAQSDA